MPIERLTVERLKRRADFLLVAGSRRKYVTPAFVLQARERDAAPQSAIRIGFTATKKIGSAVARNRARRRLREAARLLLPQLGSPGFDYVFIARGGTAERPWVRLLDDVKSALIRLAPDGAAPQV